MHFCFISKQTSRSLVEVWKNPCSIWKFKVRRGHSKKGSFIQNLTHFIKKLERFVQNLRKTHEEVEKICYQLEKKNISKKEKLSSQIRIATLKKLDPNFAHLKKIGPTTWLVKVEQDNDKC